MPAEFTIMRTVEFFETDMAGIMHFSNYFRWMEACETAFYRAVGVPIIHFVPGQAVGWPRVAVTCNYRAPLRFGDVVTVRLLVKKIGVRSITYVFQFRKSQGELVAQGEVTTAFVTAGESAGMKAELIPEILREKLQEALTPEWGG